MKAAHNNQIERTPKSGAAHLARSPQEIMKENELYAYFTITGDFDPADITARVDVEPTESWRKGELHRGNQLERKFSRWSLHSRLDRTADLEDHIRDVLSQLDERADTFRSISIEFGGCMQLVGYFNVEYPGLHFGKDIIEGLSKFTLCVDFDFYYLCSDEREDT